MREELMRHLRPVTEEEKHLIDGEKLDRKTYTNKANFEIDSKKMLEGGKSIDIRPHTRFVAFPKHCHNYIEIIYMASGKTVHTISGDLRLVLEEGDLLFLNPHTWHSIEPAGMEDIAINFMVLPEFFDVAFSMMEEENELKNFLADTLRKKEGGARYLHFHVANVFPVQNLIENMIWSILNHTENKRKIDQTTMGLLLLLLMNYTDKLEEHGKDQYENRIAANVLRYIEETYKTASLAELAARENMSACQLSRLIKKQTGQTFKELLQKKRFLQAAELLQNTELSVADIISAVGYDNTSYFYRVFRERYRMGPKELRKTKKRQAEKN